MHVTTLFQQATKREKRKLWEAVLCCEDLVSFPETALR